MDKARGRLNAPPTATNQSSEINNKKKSPGGWTVASKPSPQAATQARPPRAQLEKGASSNVPAPALLDRSIENKTSETKATRARTNSCAPPTYVNVGDEPSSTTTTSTSDAASVGDVSEGASSDDMMEQKGAQKIARKPTFSHERSVTFVDLEDEINNFEELYPDGSDDDDDAPIAKKSDMSATKQASGWTAVTSRSKNSEQRSRASVFEADSAEPSSPRPADPRLRRTSQFSNRAELLQHSLPTLETEAIQTQSEFRGMRITPLEFVIEKVIVMRSEEGGTTISREDVAKEVLQTLELLKKQFASAPNHAVSQLFPFYLHMTIREAIDQATMLKIDGGENNS